MPRVPYPTVKGIQLVLDEIGQRNPKARDLSPMSLLDLSFLKEIEARGLVRNLYEK